VLESSSIVNFLGLRTVTSNSVVAAPAIACFSTNSELPTKCAALLYRDYSCERTVKQLLLVLSVSEKNI